MITTKFKLLIITPILTISCTAFADPSFNCSKATTKIEHAICGSSQLSEYDNLMGKMYRELRNVSKAKNSQKEWVKTRNDLCSTGDADCLANLYQTRLLELDQYYSSSSRSGEYIVNGGDIVLLS